MNNQWKKLIKAKLDELSLRYGENDETIVTTIDENGIIFCFYDNGVQSVTRLPRGYQTNKYNESDCYELVNLYNSSKRFPNCFIDDEGCFVTQYWLGIGENDKMTNDMFSLMFLGTISPFFKSNDSDDYTFSDAVRDVCNGRISPQRAIDKLK